MAKRDLLKRLERDLEAAYESAGFWRTQLPRHPEQPLQAAVERALESALTTIEQLEAVKRRSKAHKTHAQRSAALARGQPHSGGRHQRRRSRIS
jgi:hypothetical protein